MSEPFITQFIHRKDGVETTLGFIGEFEDQGVVRKYAKDDPNRMLKGFVHSYKWSRDGKKWSRKWLTRTQAEEALLRDNGIEDGRQYTIPIPETFKKEWK